TGRTANRYELRTNHNLSRIAAHGTCNIARNCPEHYSFAMFKATLTLSQESMTRITGKYYSVGKRNKFTTICHRRSMAVLEGWQELRKNAQRQSDLARFAGKPWRYPMVR